MAEWTTLLEGTLRERALQTVDEIAWALRGRQGVEGHALANGLTGLALLFAELERGQPRKGHRAQAEQLILEAASTLEEHPFVPWFYEGVPGIAWAIERLGTIGVPSIENLEEVDEALLELVSQKLWSTDSDLILKLVGMGVYALERLPRPAAAGILEGIVARLEESSTGTGLGSSWWAQQPQYLPEHWHALSHEGGFNPGAVHRVPAMVALLALGARAGVARQRARELAAGGARWLLANALPENLEAGSSWSQGNPRVALHLLVAARALSDSELESTALELARGAAQHPAEHTLDAGVCHGAAGLGHIYNRLYQATREPLFKEAAASWFAQVLDLRHPGKGVAGYSAWIQAPGQAEARWVPDGTLLTGAAGIALALLAACHPFTPAWDGMLMATIPADPALSAHQGLPRDVPVHLGEALTHHTREQGGSPTRASIRRINR